MIEALKVFHEPGDVIEVRVIGKVVSSGFFKDADKALQAAMRNDGKSNVYFVLNKIKEACYHRENKDAIFDKAQSTSDTEIEQRRWILIDFDPVRPTKISSTDSEKLKSQEVMKRAGAYLSSMGFRLPIIADSGNGWHLLYRVEMPNDNESKVLVENFLKVCAMLFSDSEVSVDTTVSNASRITKLYGTIAVKGSNTAERPHRRSEITYVPKVIEKTTTDKVMRVAALLPPTPVRQSIGGQEEFNLQGFMDKYLTVSNQ